MLDRDLAKLYGVTTGNMNKAVRRNRLRFPQDFMFRLTRGEYRILRFQLGILSHGSHTKYLPYAFTEQGVAMLSGVLDSRRAVRVNVAIMRAFVRLRRALEAHGEIGRRLAEMEAALADHDSELGEYARLIQKGFQAIRGLLEAPEQPRKRIGFGAAGGNVTPGHRR